MTLPDPLNPADPLNPDDPGKPNKPGRNVGPPVDTGPSRPGRPAVDPPGHADEEPLSPAVEDERCVHDMLPGQCSICTGRDGGESETRKHYDRLLKRPGVVAAEFRGQCIGCGGNIGVGDPIRRSADDEGWVSGCCMTDDGKPRA